MNTLATQPGTAREPFPEGTSRATPRYLLLARALEDAIQSGAYGVGSLLPTEIDLAARFGVSRQTVRQAIGKLRQRGMVSARKGVGTRVDARQPGKRFSYSVLSANDLVEIAEGSELAVLTSDIVAAHGRLTAHLGCRAGHRWLHMGCTRRVDGAHRPLCWTDVYIDARLSPALSLPRHLRTALFLLVEQQSGESLTEIRQDIRATLIGEEMAERLEAPAGGAALEITRRYLSTGCRLVMVAISTLPSDRFFYSVAITRD
jgi:DNA-binding GntR family transcriptional regulator